MNENLKKLNKQYVELRALYERERHQLSLFPMTDNKTKRLSDLSKRIERVRRKIEKLQNGSVK